MSQRSADLSKLLPPSLGSLFGQPVEHTKPFATLPDPPANLPGAHAAPELCMVVDRYEEALLHRDAIEEVKIDGIRCLDIAGRLWTREGSPFEAAEHCLPILRAMEVAYGRPMFFDGEYIEEGGLERTIASFRSRKGNGCLWLFDAVPFDEWKSGQPSRQPLLARKDLLRKVLLSVTKDHGATDVGYVEHKAVSDAREVEADVLQLWREGYEGMVIKRAESFYVRKRSCDWMKLKVRSVSKMMVVDVGGCTRPVETVSANGFRVKEQRETAKSVMARLPKEGSRPILIPVLGGLADTIWANRGTLIGNMIDVEHSGFTGGGQPREASIKTITI